MKTFVALSMCLVCVFVCTGSEGTRKAGGGHVGVKSRQEDFVFMNTLSVPCDPGRAESTYM